MMVLIAEEKHEIRGYVDGECVIIASNDNPDKSWKIHEMAGFYSFTNIHHIESVLDVQLSVIKKFKREKH